MPNVVTVRNMGLVSPPDHRGDMYITYDVNIPAKIALTKISRRTKILAYGKPGFF